MDRSLLEAVRQQSDDLRDELKDLEQWEEEVERRESAQRNRKVPLSTPAVVEPPIRGTVPSLKKAVDEAARNQSKHRLAELDPLQVAKERGNEYFRVGKIDDAIHAYSTGIDLDPGSAASHLLYGNRSMCYLRQSKWDAAERDATLSIQMNRGYAKGYFRRAVARKGLGKLKEAREDLESVLALAPNDTSALTEMDTVTKMIHAEREKMRPNAAPKRKIVIEEVDEEEEEANPSSSQHNLSERDQQRHAPVQTEIPTRVQAQMRGSWPLEGLRGASEQAERYSLNNRVEVIEEIPHNTGIPVRAAEASPLLSMEGVSGIHGHHGGGSVTNADSSVSKDQTRPSPVGETEKTPPAVSSAGVATKTSVRSHRKPSKEALKTPKTFTEFERTFEELCDDDELRSYYVGLLNPMSLPTLLGSNLTPEILVGLLQSVKLLPDAVAWPFVKGISKVNRVEEIALFFSAAEKKLTQEVLTLVKKCGASEKELADVQRKLKPT